MSSVRQLSRSAGVLAVAAVAVLGVTGVPAAHAVSTVPGASATVSIECDPIPGSQFKSANWHIHMAVDAGQPSGKLFTAWADMGAGGPQYVLPGATFDMLIDARDGLGSHLIVSIDGIVVYEQIKTVVCNQSSATIGFSCGSDAAPPHLAFAITNFSPSTYNYVVHEANGVDAQVQLTANSKSIIEQLNPGQHYKASIEQNGATLTDLEGDASCGEVPPTTAPPTTVPPTTVPTGDTTPTTVKTHKSGGTTTTVAVSHATASHDDPTTSTTAAAQAASTSEQLPFTGGSSLPLGLVGLISTLVGSGVLLLLRRHVGAAQ
jgi:hypothetical protein